MTLEGRFEKHETNIAMMERIKIPYEAYDNAATGETGIAFPIERSDYLFLMRMSTRDIDTMTCYNYMFVKREDLAKDGWK